MLLYHLRLYGRSGPDWMGLEVAQGILEPHCRVKMSRYHKPRTYDLFLRPGMTMKVAPAFPHNSSGGMDSNPQGGHVC